MTTSEATKAESSLGRAVLYTARYYLGNRWGLLALGSLAVIIGLSFGGWGWLVAAGLAPIILSTLPCLVMCGLGMCMMCRSNKAPSAVSQIAADPATSPGALGVAKMDQPIVGGLSCCQGGAIEAQSPQVKQIQSLDEKRRDSHA
jgi:hypothetical protein